jgi:hypothetical protein
MLKINTDAKLNGLQIESFNYSPLNGFPLLKAKIGILADGQLCANGELFSWSEDTTKLLTQLMEAMEKDCVKTYFGKSDYESQSLYDIPLEKHHLHMPEGGFHEEYEINQF